MAARKSPAQRSARKGPVREWPQIRAMRLLLRASGRVVEGHRRYLGEHHDMLMTEFDMIAALGNTDGLKMGQLAHEMITTAGNVTRVAQALEKRGLVERTRAPHSDREVLARLTPAGAAFFRERFLQVANYTGDLIDGVLTVAEQKELAELLAKVVAIPAEPAPDER